MSINYAGKGRRLIDEGFLSRSTSITLLILHCCGKRISSSSRDKEEYSSTCNVISESALSLSIELDFPYCKLLIFLIWYTTKSLQSSYLLIRSDQKCFHYKTTSFDRYKAILWRWELDITQAYLSSFVVDDRIGIFVARNSKKHIAATVCNDHLWTVFQWTNFYLSIVFACRCGLYQIHIWMTHHSNCFRYL